MYALVAGLFQVRELTVCRGNPKEKDSSASKIFSLPCYQEKRARRKIL